MIYVPVLGLPVVLGFARQFDRLQRFTLAYATALILTTLISLFVPAEGAFSGYGLAPDAFGNITPGGFLDQWRELPAVRDGSLRQLDILHLVGIIMFPSFHAASAALFMWALWGVWWVRPFALIWNGLMLLATPIGGGHYLVDIIAGVAVAALGITGARASVAWLSRPRRAAALVMGRDDVTVV